jgi:hypothetical protein
MMGVCVAWLLIGIFITLFQCKRIDASLELAFHASSECVPYGTMILQSELSNLIIDVCILTLPLFVIARLRLPTRKKVFVSNIFILGGL